ncbi:SDR family NAD(P)-dependent oxidoreductase [Sphingomonas koreensis]|jgi:NAD(P)-dependent dehydrogenase (short-subunit alcohol dehydrogenase family)|uniref:3-oxoacyl-ACP reductase n=1 Tax=Sphingomonas koreensis TaxID=93064 RepID=A0A1L6J6W8_9SPHN|nr:SDR family NAD(P)-dependent oxidoreductase [Sphingomonas koreensis]APR51280.1 3-oxoacyl-ACP reductase [Sphingomonas koreensis]MDC7810388.1 SDR family NAD(P)-dependent oxidoreductase [Sphingomonas koreensis]RSU17568.1 SDR family NAD(P)-dependent oxidoreductase [Sphingomonas koreensis]RSU21824.1 SDR family NAD(P)-dependent oxidoreductase [Sphingomonas koreensis]RSU26191.1 SDR family NAD(P)-dependent oxidoreductase [Sphingomonas koreensis]
MAGQVSGRFAGRVAVVTGGAAGIGRAAAERMAAEGAQVSVWDISDEALAGCDFAAHTAKVDQSNEAQVIAAAADVAARLGRLDILVVSAGITGPNTTLETYPSDAWQQVMAINLNGTFFCDKAVIPHMKANGYGRIVNIASVAGKEGNPNASAYSTSKAGVIGLTKSLGKELAKDNITVNAVTPAAVKTAIFDQMTQAHIDFMLSKIPMGRFGTVDENAAMICFLASEEASFSTGAVFDTSGGRATY